MNVEMSWTMVRVSDVFLKYVCITDYVRGVVVVAMQSTHSKCNCNLIDIDLGFSNQYKNAEI